MTKKLYYQVPYVKQFQAVVQSCMPGRKSAYEVVLDQTAFYPEGGGQPYDTGLLGAVRVLEVHERNAEIVHETDGPLTAGEQVTGVLDWDRRYSHMQQHTGEHLLSGLIHSRYGYDNVGFHIGQREVTIDFNGMLTMEQAVELEREANRRVYENVPVRESFPGREELNKLDYRSKKELTGQVRIIEIPGCDICACCGTHVQASGEIGLIKITGLIHYKGGVRIFLLCGEKALLDYEKKQEQVTGISKLLSAKPEEVVEAVEKLKNESARREERLQNLYQKLFRLKASQFPDSQEALVLFEEGLNPVQLRQYCTLLYEGKKGGAVLVCSEENGMWKYAMGSGQKDMRQAGRKMNEMLGGKGGGSQRMVQGTFSSSKEEIERAFRQVI